MAKKAPHLESMRQASQHSAKCWTFMSRMVFTPLPKRLTPVPFFGYDGRHVRGGTGGGGAEVLNVVVRRKDASAIGTNAIRN